MQFMRRTSETRPGCHTRNFETPWLLAMAALFSFTACAEGPGSGTPLDLEINASKSSNLVRFPVRYPVTERRVVDGSKDDFGNCIFTMGGKAEPGVAQFQSVIEYDAATCRYTIASHPPELAPAHVRQRPTEPQNNQSPRLNVQQSDDYDDHSSFLEAWEPSQGGGFLQSAAPASAQGMPDRDRAE
jgi:hypothetical protein